MSELAHALVVMAHFHSLSSFALSCGLTPEMDTSQEYVHTGGPDFVATPLTNPALGVGRRRGENSESETPQTESEPHSPEPGPSPTKARTGQYMVQYYLNSK